MQSRMIWFITTCCLEVSKELLISANLLNQEEKLKFTSFLLVHCNGALIFLYNECNVALELKMWEKVKRKPRSTVDQRLWQALLEPSCKTAGSTASPDKRQGGSGRLYNLSIVQLVCQWARIWPQQVCMAPSPSYFNYSIVSTSWSQRLLGCYWVILNPTNSSSFKDITLHYCTTIIQSAKISPNLCNIVS